MNLDQHIIGDGRIEPRASFDDPGPVGDRDRASLKHVAPASAGMSLEAADATELRRPTQSGDDVAHRVHSGRKLRLMRSGCQRTLRNAMCADIRMDSIAERLQFLRKRAGFGTATDAARAYGWPVSTYLGHENGDRNPGRDSAKRYAAAFRSSWEWILEGESKTEEREWPTVPIVGDVGAGGKVVFAGEAQGHHDRAPRPPGASAETVAARVRGDSMPGVAEDQWLIYYDVRVAGVPDDYVGELCVVWLPDDRVYIKKVYRGRDPGTFDLISTGFEPMRDEEVEWSAKVTWIKPR